MRWSYPVLATVSDSYPEVKGRLLTCYSPVRRSSTPKRAFPLDLHVLSTPPAFVLSQDQTLRRNLQKINHPAKQTNQRKIARIIVSQTIQPTTQQHPNHNNSQNTIKPQERQGNTN
jgi:hypothetical protein